MCVVQRKAVLVQKLSTSYPQVMHNLRPIRPQTRKLRPTQSGKIAPDGPNNYYSPYLPYLFRRNKENIENHKLFHISNRCVPYTTKYV